MINEVNMNLHFVLFVLEQCESFGRERERERLVFDLGLVLVLGSLAVHLNLSDFRFFVFGWWMSLAASSECPIVTYRFQCAIV